MKIKIFVQKVHEYEALELEINRWIELNANYVIEKTESLVFTNPSTKDQEILFIIWYSE